MKAIEVIDLPAHIAACPKCRGSRLCHDGRRLSERQTDAWYQAARSARQTGVA